MGIVRIELEKGVPIPPRSYGQSSNRYSKIQFRYPWVDMKIGDSFFVPLPDGRSIRQHQINLQVAAKMSARHSYTGRRYVTRIVQSQNQKGVRVWRTK